MKKSLILVLLALMLIVTAVFADAEEAVVAAEPVEEIVAEAPVEEAAEEPAVTPTPNLPWLTRAKNRFGKGAANLYMILGTLVLVAVVLLIIFSIVKGSKDQKIEAQKAAEALAQSVTATLTQIVEIDEEFAEYEDPIPPVRAVIANGAEVNFGRIGSEARKVIGMNGDKFVSKLHFSLSNNDKVVTIKDLDSVNGTIVDGVEIHEPTIVKGGEILTFGESRYQLALEDAKKED